MDHPAIRARLTIWYQEYLKDQQSAAFIQNVARRYTMGTLERLAMHARAETRRAAVLALGFLGDFAVNPTLGAALDDADRTVRMLAENSIRTIWRRDGGPADRERLSRVIRFNLSERYEDAIREATELVSVAPAFAEAWNQRAIAHYSLGKYSASIQDCHQTLELNPFHFDAAAGMGQCYLQLGEARAALDALRRALGLNAGLDGIRAGVEQLERHLKPR